MANQYVNKVVVGDETKLDLTGDNIDPQFVLMSAPDETGASVSVNFHDKTGAQVMGQMPVTDLTDSANTSMYFPDILTVDSTIHVGADQMSVDMGGNPHKAYKGYCDVGIAQSEKDKIIAENIKKDVSILGVTGTLEALDTSDATAGTGDIVEGKTAYVDGIKIDGTMTDNAKVGATFDYTNQADEQKSVTVQSQGEAMNSKVTLSNPKSFVLTNCYKGDYMGLEVEVEPAYTLEDNEAGGQTLTIA